MPNKPVRAAAEGMPKKSVNHNRIASADNRRPAAGDSFSERKTEMNMIASHSQFMSASAARARCLTRKAVLLPLHSVSDPLLDAIKAFRDGMAAFNATGSDLSDDENNALFDVHVAKVQTALDEWVDPALTQEGAVEALRLAQEEGALYENSPIVGTMVRAALGFMEANTVTVALPGAGPVRSPLVDLIAAHKVASAAFHASINPSDTVWCEQNGVTFTEAAERRREKTGRAEERATMAICRFLPTTAAESRMKANYLLKFDGSPGGYCELSEDQQRAILLALKGGAARASKQTRV